MEAFVQGYSEDRFETVVNRNFLCPICMNVLKEPVQCQRNQHYFCTPCITKHLQENSQSCPVCIEKLTVETLVKPPRIVTDYLSSLMLSCDYFERGCREVVELESLRTHVADCSFSPIVCSNGKCMTIVNKKDKEEHETKVCEFRLVQCQDCDKEMSHKRFKKHGCLLSKEVEKMKFDLAEVKEKVAQMHSTQEEVLREVRNVMAEMKVMKKAEIKVMKKAEMKVMKKAGVMAQTVTCPSTRRDNIVVLGGHVYRERSLLNSVEEFNWTERSWTSLSAMQQRRASATSACFEGKIIVAGGRSTFREKTDRIEQMLFDQEQERWLDFPVKLPYKCSGHKTVIHNQCLLVVGGFRSNRESCTNVNEVQLKPPYTSRFLSRLPRPISFHGMEHFNENILIIGGTTTGFTQGSVDNVLLYDMNNQTCQEMAPLPFCMCDMATVRWGDDVIIIGGSNVTDEALNTVFMYNYKEGKCQELPSMKYKRAESAAVISGNAIVVMGGYNKVQGSLNSVELFTFESYMWQDLPPMIEQRNKPTAVIKPVNNV